MSTRDYEGWRRYGQWKKEQYENYQKQMSDREIMNAKKEYDRTWDGVFVPMGKEGSSQRKEYERRGALFKAASAKYKALLKRHKVATFK